MKAFFSVIFVLILLSASGFVGYVVFDYIKDKNSLQFTPIVIDDIEKPDIVASSSIRVIVSNADRSDWKKYSNQEFGYELQYPSDLIINQDDSSLLLAFPKKIYFSWPLLDDAKVTVYASSTCLTISDSIGQSSTTTIVVGDRIIDLEESSDIGAGNIHKTMIFSMNGENFCHNLTFDSKGANGAGLFVGDSSVRERYDQEHKVNNDRVIDIVYGILESLVVSR